MYVDDFTPRPTNHRSHCSTRHSEIGSGRDPLLEHDLGELFDDARHGSLAGGQILDAQDAGGDYHPAVAAEVGSQHV